MFKNEVQYIYNKSDFELIRSDYNDNRNKNKAASS